VRFAWLLLLLAGCENVETFSGQVSVAPEVAPDAQARVLLLINDDYRYPAETVEGMWGTKPGGVYVVEPSADPDAETPIAYAAGRLAYTYWHEEVAYYPSEVWVGAFLDLDGDGAPGEDEPWGAYADNPITDLPRVSQADDPVIADITIDRIGLTVPAPM
jgi:hypothetical protein